MEMTSKETQANREKCRRYYWRNKEKQRQRCLSNYFKRREIPTLSKELTAINRRAKAKQRYGEAREVILARFNHQCANCGSGKYLRIHHKDNQGRKVEGIAKANNSPENLMVVCQRCHLMHHRWGYYPQMKT